jgi:acrylyl-CoA reductase (NADPH)
VSHTFRALLAQQTVGKSYAVAFREMETSDLPAGEVLVEVAYSSLNYKDALAITAKGKIIRRFPMVLGLDLAATVVESASPEFKPGDRVVGHGQGLGELIWGGYTRMQRLSADVLVPVPSAFDLRHAMAAGTAGVTAMLCVLGLEHMDVRPSDREIVVSGAAGGVGSLAVILLAQLGYKVAASTGRSDAHSYLRDLGAASIIERAYFSTPRPALASERWAGAIDTVGGQTLASIIAETASYGAVAACGMVGGADIPVSVFPFILRNVTLLGITSLYPNKALRMRVWQRLAKHLPLAKLESITSVEPLSKIFELADKILAGQVRGRIVIDVNS